MNEVRLRPVARLRVVGQVRLAMMQRGFERARDDLLLPRRSPPAGGASGRAWSR